MATKKKISRPGALAARAYLEKKKLMTVAVSSKNRPWAAIVFFAPLPRFALLFYSKAQTRHARAIAENPHVAVTVGDRPSTPFLVEGIQLQGKAKVVRGKNREALHRIFCRRYPWADRFSDHTLYRIFPREVYYINQRLFGHHSRVRVF